VTIKTWVPSWKPFSCVNSGHAPGLSRDLDLHSGRFSCLQSVRIISLSVLSTMTRSGIGVRAAIVRLGRYGDGEGLRRRGDRNSGAAGTLFRVGEL
jgi:hypothetical protein